MRRLFVMTAPVVFAAVIFGFAPALADPRGNTAESKSDATQARPGPAKSQTTSAFDRLKLLVGEWQGKTENGRPARLSYALISGGTCVQETLSHGDTDMVTIYCPDGDRLMMTHYCADNNQPRMRAEPVAGEAREIVFSFVDATNLSGPSAGHMHRLVLTFPDASHLTQVWTYRRGDTDQKEVFHFERKG